MPPRARSKPTPAPVEAAADAPNEPGQAPAEQGLEAAKRGRPAAPVARIVAGIGKIPGGTTHFFMHRVGANGRASERITVEHEGMRLDEFPIEVLAENGIEIVKAQGPGRYMLTWMAIDGGSRRGLGRSKVLEPLAPPAPKAAAERPKSAAEIEAEAYRKGREDAVRDLDETYRQREAIRADATRSILEAFQAKNLIAAPAAVPAAPSEDMQRMRVELEVLKARQAWEAEQREREEEDEEEEEEEAETAALARVTEQNPEGLAAQIAQIAAVAKALVPLLPLAGALLSQLRPVAPPAPIVTPPPAAPAPGKPRARRKPAAEVDTQSGAAPAAAE